MSVCSSNVRAACLRLLVHSRVFVDDGLDALLVRLSRFLVLPSHMQFVKMKQKISVKWLHFSAVKD